MLQYVHQPQCWLKQFKMQYYILNVQYKCSLEKFILPATRKIKLKLSSFYAESTIVLQDFIYIQEFNYML